MNQLVIEASIAELQPLRLTPTGVPVASCRLEHASEQEEAGLSRSVSVELNAVALGELARMLGAAQPGMKIRGTGFLAAKSLRSRNPVLHLNKIEFLEGN